MNGNRYKGFIYNDKGEKIGEVYAKTICEMITEEELYKNIRYPDLDRYREEN